MLRRIASLVTAGSDSPSNQHTITSPTLIKKTSDLPAKKRETSLLATAFENAWKNGCLAENMGLNSQDIATANLINSNASTNKEVEKHSMNNNNSFQMSNIANSNGVNYETNSRKTKTNVTAKLTPLKSKSSHPRPYKQMSLPLQSIQETPTPSISRSSISSSMPHLNSALPSSRLSTASSPHLLSTLHPPPSTPPPPPPFKPPPTPPSTCLSSSSRRPRLSKASSTPQLLTSSKQVLCRSSKPPPPLPSAHSISLSSPTSPPPPPIPPRPFPPNQRHTAKIRRQNNLTKPHELPARPSYPRKSSLATNKLEF